MKKLIICCLILVLSVSMAACSGDNSKNSSSEAYTSISPDDSTESLISVEESAPVEVSGESAASMEESASSTEDSSASSGDSSSSTEESTSSAA